MAVRNRAQYWLPLAALLCSCATSPENDSASPDNFIVERLELHELLRARPDELLPLHPARPSLVPMANASSISHLHFGSLAGGFAKSSHPAAATSGEARAESRWAGALAALTVESSGAMGAFGAARAEPRPAAVGAAAERIPSPKTARAATRGRTVAPALRTEPTAAGAAQEIAQTGSAAYHIPRKMKLNEASQVELWIDLSGTAERLRAALSEKLKLELDQIGTRVKLGADSPLDPKDVVGKEKVWVGQHMTASLRGEGFKIEPEGARGKSLAAEGKARWNWSVTPQRDPGGGKLMLLLEASIDRGADQDAFPSIEEYVEVELAPWWQRIPDLLAKANALLALFGLGLGAVIVYAAKWLRKHWGAAPPFPRLRI